MYQGAVQDLIDELGRLPGVGPKSAQRIAFYILNSPADEMAQLASAITTVKTKVSFCEICGNISETPKCSICRDARRDGSLICVVEEPKDVSAIERTGSFSGRYHVLGGSINPMQGIGPDRLRIRELVTRLADEEIQEIILAMDPNLEGEATATYLSRMLTPIGITVSRLASGLPVGGDLEYADEITLGRALEGRRILTAGQRQAQQSSPPDPQPADTTADERDAPETSAEESLAPSASPEGEDSSTGSHHNHDADDTSEPEASDSDVTQSRDDGQRPSDQNAPTAQESSTGILEAPEEPTVPRRYPTPRRGEKFANPWAE
ncbi:recombination mediator RecR [Kocuria sp. HSID16901]|uniref:recombination mediator RecR n=1 Tax=Kocuria sp. HSID16901 TaxID=2419505 RepID=UPI0009E4307B|nr:recombination mediator RecR [Kocuria sp. HSID16901]MCT1368085.1 recombination mediator RecR [Rothia sp. p3-SID1597]RUQ19699.1 recombination protein RecR [Kocuria sp. HSID16901]